MITNDYKAFLQFIEDQGFTGQSNDAQWDFLKSQGLTGTLDDMWKLYLISIGLDGALADMAIEWNTSPYGTSFVFSVETTTPNETITIPAQNDGVFNATIQWGDDSSSTITTFNDADLAHQYAEAGTHIIQISGDFPNIYWNNSGDAAKVRRVIQLGDVGWTTLENSWYGCTGMISFASGTCDVALVVNIDGMLRDTTSLEQCTVSSMDTGVVDSMNDTFRNTAVPSLDISDWDILNVRSMDRTFQDSDIVTLRVPTYSDASLNVVTMVDTFKDMNMVLSLADVGDWETDSLTTATGTFSGVNANDMNLTNWYIENVTDLTNFLLGVTLPESVYESMLVAWEAQTEQTGVTAHFGNSTYSSGSLANVARDALTGTSTWVITDGGPTGTSGVAPVITFFEDDITGGAYSVEFYTNTAGTITWDFHSSSVAPAKGAGDIGTGSYVGEAGVNNDNIDLSSFDMETGYLHFRLTNPQGDSDPQTGQVITTPSAGAATAPDAFTVGQWSIADSVGSIDVTINSLPNSNGAAITDIDYRVDGGVWTSSGGTVSFTIGSVTAGSRDVEIRAVNSVGDSAASDLKSVTVTSTASVPDAFVSGDWSGADGDSLDIDITINSLPADNGAAITDIEYNVDSAGWVSSGGTTSFNIPGELSTGSRSVELRAINSEGSGGTNGKSITVNAAKFMFTVRTTGAAETVTLPCNNSGTFNATVDWGDGSSSTITTYNDADLAHEYAVADDYIVKISGQFPNIRFNNGGDRAKVINVLQLGDVSMTAADSAWRGCNNMTDFTAAPCDMTGAFNLNGMLRQCSGLVNADFTGINYTGARNLGNLCRDCTSLTNVVGAADLGSGGMTSATEAWTNVPATNIDIAGWDVTSGSLNLVNLFGGTAAGPSTSLYDALLVAWEAQAVPNNETADFGNATYTSPSAAATARAALISDHTWTINDGGTA